MAPAAFVLGEGEDGEFVFGFAVVPEQFLGLVAEAVEAFFGGEVLLVQFLAEDFEGGHGFEFLGGGVVSHVLADVVLGKFDAPLGGGHAPEGEVEDVGLDTNEAALEHGIGSGGKVPKGCGGNELVVLGGELTGEAFELGILTEEGLTEEAVGVDGFDVEAGVEPVGEMDGPVGGTVGAAVAAAADLDAGAAGGDEVGGGDVVAVEAGIFFNPFEFEGIKVGVVHLLPGFEEGDGVGVAHPVLDVEGSVALEFGDIGDADEAGVFVYADFGTGDGEVWHRIASLCSKYTTYSETKPFEFEGFRGMGTVMVKPSSAATGGVGE